MKRWLRIGLLATAACLTFAIGVAGVLIARFDPNEWKPRIVAAVREATGRDLSLNGRIGLKWSLSPAIEVQDVVLANPPGFSRPAMATLQRLDLRLALLPLLGGRVEIGQLRIVRPDIRLETDATGRSNWAFAAEKPVQPTPGAAGTGETRAPRALGFADVRIEDGVLAYRDGATGQTTSLAIRQLAGQAASPDAPVRFGGDVVFNDVLFKIDAETGPLARLQDRAATTPWPIRLGLETGGAKLSVEGTLTQPARGRGYRVTLTGTAADLNQVARLLPHAGVPAVRDIGFSAVVTDRAMAIPEISALRLRTGRVDLGAYRAGLALDSLEIDAPALDQPIKATVHALGATIDLRATVGGTIGKRLDLKGFGLSSPDGDVAGDVSVDFALPATATAVLRSNRIDLDAILARLPNPRAASAAPNAAGPADPTPASAGAHESARLFSDHPIAFGMLRLVNADVRVAIGVLRAGDAEYRAIDAHLALHDGKMTLDPFSAELPGGRLDARLTVDAAPVAPVVSLFVHAPKLALRPLLAALHQPGLADGILEIYADLHGAGETPHAIASSLSGSLGVALADGSVDNKALGQALGRVAGKSDVLNLASRGGRNELRCFASRSQFEHGVGASRALTLSSTLLTLRGGGSIDLGAETVALHVTPQGRIGGNGIVLPLKIAGPIRGPAVSIDTVVTAEGKAGSIVGLVIGDAAQLGALGAFGGGDICAGPLAIARGEQAAPEIAAVPQTGPPQTGPPQTGKAPKPIDLLRQLLR